MILEDVLHVPNLSTPLLSVNQLVHHEGYKVAIDERTTSFYINRTLAMTATASRILSYLDGYVIPAETSSHRAFFAAAPIDANLLHRRLGHCGKDRMKTLITKSLADGLNVSSQDVESMEKFCEDCLAGKLTKEPYAKAVSYRPTAVGELVSTDLKVELPLSHDGFRHWAVYIDHASRFCCWFLLRKKSEQQAAYRQYEAFFKAQTGRSIQTILNDAGGEYTPSKWLEHLAAQGTLNAPTPTDTPSLTGVAERSNRTASEAITSMLHDAGLPPNMWSEGLRCYQEIHNKLPTSSNVNFTPFEAFYGRKPSLSHARIFGSVAYVHVLKKNRRPFSSKMVKCIIVGYHSSHLGYRLWNPTTKKIVISRDVKFDERPKFTTASQSGGMSTPQVDSEAFPNPEESFTPGNAEVAPTPPSLPGAPQIELERQDSVPAAGKTPNHREESVEQAALPEPRRSERPRTQTVPYWERGQSATPSTSLTQPSRDPSAEDEDEEDHYAGDSDTSEDPLALLVESMERQSETSEPREAVNDVDPELANSGGVDAPSSDKMSGALSPLSRNSLTAHPRDSSLKSTPLLSSNSIMALAFHALSENPQTWQECLDRPDRASWQEAANERQAALLQQQVYEVVPRPPNRKVLKCRPVFAKKPDRYQVRIAAKGFGQIKGVDFFETFSPVASYETIRLVLSIAAYHDLFINAIDFSQAFLNSKLDEEVYMEQPAMWHDGSSNVWLLKKSIDGLKQSSRMWYLTLTRTLKELGFIIMLSLPSVCLLRKGKSLFLIPIYVDDELLISNDPALCKWIVEELGQRYPVKDLGEATSMVGTDIERDWEAGTIALSSTDYINRLVTKYDKYLKFTSATPMEEKSSLSKQDCPQTDAEVEYMKEFPYMEIGGSINWLAITYRADCAYAVGNCMRYAANPGPAHRAALCRILQYLKGTANLKLVLGRPISEPLQLSGEQSGLSIQAFSDASYGDSKDDGKSTSGHVGFLNGSLINWSAKKQPVVACSTMESELIAENGSGRHIGHMRHALKEMGFEQKKASILWCDNQAAIKVANAAEYHGRAKHMNIRYHWIREAIENGEFVVKYMPTRNQIADLFTKPLGSNKFKFFRSLLGLI